MSTMNTEATGRPTPIAGCMIFLVIIGMISFLAIFAWYKYGEYKTEIVNISQLDKDPIKIADISDQSAVLALNAKMRNFKSAVKDKKRAEISFTSDEINLAIAHYSKLESFRGNLNISAITSQHILADISFEVRAGFDGIRYLNGSMVMKPIIAMGSLFPEVTEIKPNTGNPVPPKMIREFPTFLFTEYRNDKELADVFHKLSKVILEPGLMTIISDPTIPIDGEIPENIESETERAVALFGLLVFMLVTTVAFFVWLKKRKITINATSD